MIFKQFYLFFKILEFTLGLYFYYFKRFIFRHVFLISGTHVIGFDVYTGKRICLLKHGTQVVGVTWKNDKVVFTWK